MPAPVVVGGTLEGFIYTTYSNWKEENITLGTPVVISGTVVNALVSYSNWKEENITLITPLILNGTLSGG